MTSSSGSPRPATTKYDLEASAAIDAHFGAALTFDYYPETHGRNGIFDEGTGVPSRTDW